MKATIYHNPKCSKSCAALAYLERYKDNMDIEVKLYMEKGISRSALLYILELLDCPIDDIMRKDETLIDKYCSGMLVSKEGMINCIVENPILLQRPIILFKEKAVGSIARSEEAIMDLFKLVKIELCSANLLKQEETEENINNEEYNK